MKPMKSIILAVIFCAALLSACSKVDPPYYTTREVTIDTNLRSVLLEDYTGMKCQNCPEAAEVARTLEELYKNQVFVIAVHAGYFANPDSNNPSSPFYSQDFRNATSQTWMSTFKVVTNPLGLINRAYYQSTTQLPVQAAEWPNAVAAQVKLPKAAVMSMHNGVTIAKGDTTLSTSVQVRFLKKFEGKYNLCVCITEDSIVGVQQVGPTIKYDYVFNDLLRGAVNGFFGEQITAANDTVTVLKKDYTQKLSGKWNTNNMNVVAFILNGDTKQVLHIIKGKAK